MNTQEQNHPVSSLSSIKRDSQHVAGNQQTVSDKNLILKHLVLMPLNYYLTCFEILLKFYFNRKKFNFEVALEKWHKRKDRRIYDLKELKK